MIYVRKNNNKKEAVEKGETMYETAYEILYHDLMRQIISGGTMSAIFLVAALGAVARLYAKIKCREENKLKDFIEDSIPVIFLTCLFIFMFRIFCFDLQFSKSRNYYLSEEYYAGNYESVEGQIRDLTKIYVEDKSHTSEESFFVEDVFFKYGEELNFCFVNEDRVIQKEGQQVRICYIPYYVDEIKEWRNIIVRVDIKEE